MNMRRSLLGIALLVFLAVSCTNSKATKFDPTSTKAILSISSPTITITPIPQGEKAGTECISSFENFAFENPEDRKAISEDIFPLYPWKLETSLLNISDTFMASFWPVASRYKGEQSELWISSLLRMKINDVSPNTKPFEETREFLVYFPATGDWQTIPNEIDETGFYVGDLFVTKDGTIWGQNLWGQAFSDPDSMPESIPTLSIFNEKTRKFEIVGDMMGLSRNRNEDTVFKFPKILKDDQDVFWFFIIDDGIYRFDPAAPKAVKYADLPFSGLLNLEVALSKDGSIFLQTDIYDPSGATHEVELYQFDPKTKDIVKQEIPEQLRSHPTSMFVDHLGRLWFGAVSYREPDGAWNFVPAQPDEYFSRPKYIFGWGPGIMMESSNGFLWFYRSTDAMLVDGTAWYDPNTNTGCQFTTIPGNIIEDSENVLWMMANEKLYKYELNP